MIEKPFHPSVVLRLAVIASQVRNTEEEFKGKMVEEVRLAVKEGSAVPRGASLWSWSVLGLRKWTNQRNMTTYLSGSLEDGGKTPARDTIQEHAKEKRLKDSTYPCGKRR